MRLTAQQFDEYVRDPLAYDPVLRQLFRVPEDRYYSVSVWPHHLAGFVWLTAGIRRVIRSVKISKSPQPCGQPT